MAKGPTVCLSPQPIIHYFWVVCGSAAGITDGLLFLCVSAMMRRSEVLLFFGGPVFVCFGYMLL